MLASIAYLPTRESLNAQAFLFNLGHYKTRHPVLFYSDADVEGCHRIDNAEVLKGHRNRTAIHNYVFLSGLKMALERGLDRFIYLEPDVRVGCDDWDGKIFREADEFTCPDGMVCAGTPCIWNASEMPITMREAVNQYMNRYRKASGFAPPAFHSRTKDFQTRPGNNCLFIMGAGAVYDVPAMMKIFHKAMDNPMVYATQIQAFDLHIGLWCARAYGSGAIDRMPWLRSIWSGYKDKVYDQQQREEMLVNGKVCLVHQIKTNDPLICSAD